ncbi:MAG: outer membrane beta-barrel protein [Candidatus Omnitrophota bacterium]|nr:MAG: outer membrane beta-barrel protein [Candidatus Omnitrophota bacterium]
MKAKVLVTAVCALGAVSFSCYGDISREDVISFHLDYYEFKHEDKEEEERVTEERQEMEKERAKKSQERRERVNELLKKISEDLSFFVSVEAVYDDNAFKTSVDEDAEFFTTLDFVLNYNPDLFWKLGHTKFSLNFQGGPNLSITNNEQLNKAMYLVKGDVSHVRGKYGANVSGQFKKEFVPFGDIGVGDAAVTIDRYIYTYGAKFFAEWKRFPWDVEYTHEDVEHESGSSDSDTSKDRFSFTNYFELSAKTRLLLSHDYETVDYPNRDEGNSKGHTTWVGIRGEISPKIDGLIRGGYQFTEIEEGDETETETVEIELDYDMSRRLSHTLRIGRATTATPYSTETWTEGSSFLLTSSYLPPITKRLRLGAHIVFEQDDFSSNREDRLWGGGVSAEYALKKDIKFTGRYQFRKKTSTEPDVEYKNNIITLRLTKEF